MTIYYYLFLKFSLPQNSPVYAVNESGFCSFTIPFTSTPPCWSVRSRPLIGRECLFAVVQINPIGWSDVASLDWTGDCVELLI